MLLFEPKIEPKAYKQHFLFLLANEAKLAEVLSPSFKWSLGLIKQKPLFDQPVQTNEICFYDTKDFLFRENKIQISHVGVADHSHVTGGKELYAFNRNNPWETQARCRIDWDAKIAGQDAIPSQIDKSKLKLFVGEYTIQQQERLLNTHDADIMIRKTRISDLSPEFLEISAVSFADHFPEVTVPSPSDPQACAEYEKECHAFERRNYLNMLIFIDNAFNASALVPFDEMPNARMRVSKPAF